MLNSSERVRVRQAVVRIRARNLQDAELILRGLMGTPRRQRSEPYDYPRLPGLHDVFACPKLKGFMSIEDCLVRRSRAWPSGGGRGCPRHDECKGCETGILNQALRPEFVPPPSTLAPEVLNWSQRTARRARQLVGLEDGETVRVDPLREASDMTRTDDSDWRT